MNRVSDFIVDITEENVQAELLEKSSQLPVLVDVWADWCEPCRALSPVLERLVSDYEGKFVLAKINADEQQNLAAQLQVRSLPTLKLIVEGQIVGELVGLQPESAIKAMLAPYIGQEATLSMDNIESQIESVDELCVAGDFEHAQSLLKELIEKQPESEVLKVRYARLLLNLQAFEDAQTVMNSLTDETQKGELGKQFDAHLYFAELVQCSSEKEKLVEQIKQNEADPEAKLFLAAHQVMSYDNDSALEIAWNLFANHRDFTLENENSEANSDQMSASQKSLLALFDLLGKKDARVSEYRRKMFALLH